MNPLDHLKTLSLDPDHYLVVGSALLSIKGIKPLNDIDLLVHSNLFKKLQTQDWKSETIVQEGKSVTKLSHDICEAFTEFRGKTFDQWTRDPSRIETIDDIRFLNLHEILRIKQEWQREKDARDIHLIKKYLSENN